MVSTGGDADGADFEQWLRTGEPVRQWTSEQRALLKRAFDLARAVDPGGDGPRAGHQLAGLNLDVESIIAALLHGAVSRGALSLDRVRADYPPAIAGLIENAAELDRSTDADADRGQRSPEQLDRLRKMLLAMAHDVRVVLIVLALRLCLLRKSSAARDATQTERRRIAQQTLNIHAPLANRLGIGQLKWELEDLALRDLKPDIYKALAAAIAERRSDREGYIHRVMDQLQAALTGANIDAQVSGRAKHIYSIWNKMRRKQLLFDQLFDVRALRIMVGSVAECYAALGVVHSTWKNLPDEFDDYIANPKPNGYQSLHTAVVGPGNRTIEVQIRSREMHRHAELGIAAHWRYKEGGGARSDHALEKQIQWLRQALADDESGESDGVDAGDVLDQLDNEAGGVQRVYVRTPKGDIVDLGAGATPLDFAYHVHTEVGHRCRGARVNGRIVPLNTSLQNGDQIDILTVKEGAPSRDWLSRHLGYLQTARARAKVRLWFRQLDREKNVQAGKLAFEQTCRRLNVAFKQVNLDEIGQRFNVASADDLFAAIGSGDLTAGSVAAALPSAAQIETQLPPVKSSPAAPTGADDNSLQIRGVGRLLTQIARCCRPVPFESVVGYVTQGRGVSVHRADCANVLNLRNRHPERFIEVEWDEPQNRAGKRFVADVRLITYDRPGLLRDVSTLLANDRVNVFGVNTHSDQDDGTALMDLSLEVSGLEQLNRVLDKLGQLNNVRRAYRKNAGEALP